VEEPQQLLLLIAKTLAVSNEGNDLSFDWLAAALRNRRLLLLLDNFEQILDAAPCITALLGACAQISAIITSRTPLDVYGEHQLVVQPLPVPPPGCWRLPAEIDSYEAIQLFIARIHAHNPTFHLTPENSPAVAELCFRLDGIPLAIELAAGLTRAESPHLLLADIEREGRLALLTTTQRDRTARQQTLREAIAWSVRRLSPLDQVLFARLGVFQGTFDLASAYAVAGVAGDGTTLLPLEDFAARLRALAASHLVQLQPGAETPRYRLLDTLREYARETLQATINGTEETTEATTSEMLAAQQRHAQHFAALAAAIDPAQSVGNLHEWRQQLRPDYPNLLAALLFALTMADVALTLKLACGLGHFWYLEGSWQEGVHWLAQALALPGGAPAIRARANTEAGIIYSAMGNYPQAERHLAQARAEAAQAGDLFAMAWTLTQLSQTALLQGQAVATRAYTLERLEIYRCIGDSRYLAITLEHIGCAAVEEGDYPRGIPWLEECQTLWEVQDSRAGVAAVNLIIGMAELAQGNATSALARFQKGYEDFNTLQHSHGLPWSLRNLGLGYLAVEQLPQAQFSLLRSLERYLTLTGNESAIAVIVEAIAGIATQLGKHHLAAHLMGAAAVARQQARLPLTENSRQIYARLLAPSINTLGQTEWEQALAVGATLPWREAVASARALLIPQSDTQTRGQNNGQNKTAVPLPKEE
jgi:predicted ATPase